LKHNIDIRVIQVLLGHANPSPKGGPSSCPAQSPQ
jgi:hypothetical protein